MKYLILLVMALSLDCTMWAEEKNVPLHNDSNSSNTKSSDCRDIDRRSLSIDPRATYDASTLYLYAPLEWENVEVTLYDAYGNVLFTEVVTLSPVAYRIELDGFEVKNFMVELATDEASYYGEFSL